MQLQIPGIRWGVEQRLEFIEFRLFWESGVNRSDITEFFGVSVPQASKDLALYQEMAPTNVRYDKSQKKYLASDEFVPRFISTAAESYLDLLVDTEGGQANWLSCPPSFDRSPIPHRQVDGRILRSILKSVREAKSIKVHYQSMNPTRPVPVWRRISPHALASDGLRWHLRAYCHLDEKFKDFILSRCLDVRDIGEPGAAASDDRFWTTFFAINLSPNPQLSVGQQEVIAADYQMESNKITVRVRQALLYYFQRRLRLDLSNGQDDPHETPIVIKNQRAFEAALAEAMQ